VESHIRNYSAASSKKHFRSSHVTELFSLLRSHAATSGSQPSDPATSLKLVTDGQPLFAMWSLTFGVAQFDSKAHFKRIFAFEKPPKGSQFCMKCAKSVVNAMRLMFPLPVAIISTISKLEGPSGEDLTVDLVTSTIHHFLNEVKPFCVWSMQKVAGEDSLEICVHVDTKKDVDTKKRRIISCTFRGLADIPVHEMQVAISSILHKEYGMVPIAFATMPKNPPSLNLPSVEDPTSGAHPAAISGSEVKLSEPVSDFIKRILSSCLQSTKVLLILQPPCFPQRAEQFILEQALDCFSLYSELAADFFIDMREELQQRIHGEDADGICRSACEHIKRSAAASLPLHFHRMELETQDRLICYLPEQFLRRSLMLGDEDPKLVLPFEHDFDFPVFSTIEDASHENAKLQWTAYWEYLFLNCGDSRPYAPCWDPIALQEKAKEVYRTIEKRTKESMENIDHLRTFNLSDCKKPYLLTELYQHCRWVVVGDMLQHWKGIQEAKRYSDHDASVLMRRFERSIRKVFYFLLCCKPILFCQTCLSKCCLDPDADDADSSKTDYALKCSMCERSVLENGETLKKPVYCAELKKLMTESYKQTGRYDGKNVTKKLQDLAAAIASADGRKPKVLLKKFCFRWFMKVGFCFKKACSIFLLHRGHPSLTSDIIISSVEKVDRTINLSHSRDKLGIPMLKDAEERSRLRKLFLQVVEICRSGMITVQRESLDHASVDSISHTLAAVMLSIVTMSEHVNRAVAECNSLRTGCSTFEAFPSIVSEDAAIPISDKMTHLMVAAIEGSVRNASAYIAAADIPYIFRQYDDDVRSIHSESFTYLSCALHMALERGNTDVANAIIDRTSNLVLGGTFEESRMLLDGLFLGASMLPRDQEFGLVAHNEIPTSFMYLARYAMTDAMDKIIVILKHLKKAEEMQPELRRYMIKPRDCNGMNALHYAVLSQSPHCVSWFIPYMHDFHVCNSNSKSAFVPLMSINASDSSLYKFEPLKAMMQKPTSFHFGYPKFLRAHPPSDFSDSDCRLVISEDWIQTYHHSASRIVDLDVAIKATVRAAASHERAAASKSNQVAPAPVDAQLDLYSQAADKKAAAEANAAAEAKAAEAKAAAEHKKEVVDKIKNSSRKHKEMSPYELALLLWRVMDIESVHAQEYIYNIRTNSSNGDDSSQAVKSKSATTDKESSEDAFPERLAEAYKQRSNSFSGILSKLEEAANDEMDIDAKKKKGLRQFTDYRNRRAISRMVFPVIAYVPRALSHSAFCNILLRYLGYVIASTLMAFLMTNGLMDEPTKFTRGVINELQWGPQNGPQKNIKDIGSYNDLTVFWGVLAGFLWSASPMARSFGANLCTN